ncbi:MAG TPA: QueT transporter family protein [Anaerolineae bacterium]|nr:QueT transporter family protein [Anaerolineae bacterium]
MILLVALCAAVYAAVLIVFKAGIVLIPGITEVRPANLLPIVFSLLFGPAAAWGTAIGNLIGDFFGTLGPGSFFGFIGNFFLGYVPYKVWGHLGPLSSGEEPRMRTWRQWLELIVISLISAAACAVIISWGVDLLGLVPFKILSTIITVNDTIGHIAGGILLLLVWDRVKAIGLYWREVMAPEDIAKPVAPKIGSLLLVIGGVVGWIVGAFLLPPAMAVPVGAIFVVATLVPLLLL